jgi:hydrogenase maturation protease
MTEKPSEGFRMSDQSALQKVLVIGIGNEYRNDDGIGLAVARKVRERNITSVVVREESGEGAALMEAWQGYESIILIDAVSSGKTPGTVFRIDARKKKVQSKFFFHSTHAFSVAEAIELARAMETLPSRLIVYGIEGANFSSGLQVSQTVQKAVEQVVEQIVHEIGKMTQ